MRSRSPNGYSYDSLHLEYRASGNYTTIKAAQSGELITTLIGVTATDLSAADFITV